MIVAPCLVAALLAGAAADDAPRLAGGFIQYWPVMTRKPEAGGLNAAQWRNFLDAMRDAKLRVIIIQWTCHDGQQYVPQGPEFADPTGIIIQYAEKNHMDVYIGLKEDGRWFTQGKWRDKDFLDGLARDGCKLAGVIQGRYGHSPRFRGWYLSQEMWNQDYTAAEIQLLSGFFRQVGDYCRGLAPDRGRRVAVSPFFNPWTRPGEKGQAFLAAAPFAHRYGQFLEGARIDLVMLQDGVGARGLKAGDLRARVVPYYQALRDVCGTKVELWGNVESFEIVPGQPNENRFWPADIGRFQTQIQLTAPYVQGRLVTFDLFHYMNPYGSLHQGQDGGAYPTREKSLYDAYRQTFVP